MEYHFGVDIGGTFTDIVLLSSDGILRSSKLASTTHDYAEAIFHGLKALMEKAQIDPASIYGIVHGTTIATNTILESRGARTGLVTTRGFRDVLEMRRLRIPQMYNLQYTPPAPLAPRRLRLEVDERTGPKGEIWRALDEASVERAAERLVKARVEAVAVSLINSYANPDHEKRVGEILRTYLPPTTHITLSAEILPEIREYERTSTTVVNAYIAPIVENYLSSLETRLKNLNITAPLRMMQSNGGVMGAKAAASKPAYIIESGPAAGVIAAVAMARRISEANVISLDMGGTTAKAALVENGEPAKTGEYEVGAGINLSSKLVKGGGHAVKLPYIDISEIGAGGGSIIAVDTLGGVKVGPRSAGAEPGPACYGLGGSEATFTDAMVVLGYLNPNYLAGGEVRLHSDLAYRAISERVARPLGVDPARAAWGAYAICASSMTRAVKAVSTFRGRDPRDFALMAFGGNGPVVAVQIAQSLGMKKVIVPPFPGVFSAFGLLCSDIEYTASRTIFRRLDDISPSDIRALLHELEIQTRSSLASDGVSKEAMILSHLAELRYAGQAYELPVPLDAAALDLKAIACNFDREHARTYGHSSPGAPTDLVSLKVVGRAVSGRDASILSGIIKSENQDKALPPRRAYFGPRGYFETRVISRTELKGRMLSGPLIVEEYDATCVIPPEATARLDEFGNIAIDTGSTGK